MDFGEQNKRSSDPPPRRSGRPGKDGSEGKGGFSWKGPIKSLGFWIIIILAFIFAYSLYTSSDRDVAEISYSEFINQF
jgi:hypothetical protein